MLEVSRDHEIDRVAGRIGQQNVPRLQCAANLPLLIGGNRNRTGHGIFEAAGHRYDLVLTLLKLVGNGSAGGEQQLDRLRVPQFVLHGRQQQSAAADHVVHLLLGIARQRHGPGRGQLVQDSVATSARMSER